MKFWGITAALCLLFQSSPQQQSIYTVSTDHNQTIISWHTQISYRGHCAMVTISPDHRSVAWVEQHLAGYTEIDHAHLPVYAGTIYIAHDGNQPVKVREIRRSRGFEMPEGALEDGITWNPTDLQWDSTSEFLYFITQSWPTRSMLWQLRPGAAEPKAIVPVWNYRLLRKSRGSDWVEAYETNYAEPPVYRDWTTTCIYTPEDMASEDYVRPARRSSVSKDWPQYH